tara:strand:+ start:2452 stop:2913 length:462 start_codon:yes stop_codon:yes gene_type:complete
MALSNATRLADFGTGIGTLGAVLKVDNNTKRVGLGTTNPQRMVQVGQNVTIDDSGINLTGVITATSFEGSGANLTGVSGFGTAVNSTQGTLGNLVYKTPRDFVMSGVTSVYLNSDTTSGGMLFTRLGGITVGGASTLHIGSGTTLAMDVLKLF